MVSFSVAVFPFSVIYQTMNISLCSDASVRFPGIRTECRTLFHLFGDQREKSGLIVIGGVKFPTFGGIKIPT
jgi:hypothetical protein